MKSQQKVQVEGRYIKKTVLYGENILIAFCSQLFIAKKCRNMLQYMQTHKTQWLRDVY